jgi:hypothetical protein
MRIAGYILAFVIAVAAIVVGFVTKGWLLAGFGIGFLGVSIYRVSKSGEAQVEGNDDAIFAIFNMPIWPDGVISIVILAVGIALGFMIFKIIGWA